MDGPGPGPGQGGIVKNNVGLILAKRAHLSPTLEAVIEPGGRRLVYAELDARANRIANALSGLGVGKGDRVALLLMNGAEFIETFFGLAKLGAVVVPVNWRLVPDELAFILKDSGSVALVYGGEFAGNVAELHGRGPAGSGIEHWIHVGPGATRAGFALDYAELQDAASDASPAIPASDGDLLYIMYTSGTTGLPKGAVHTHASALWALLTIGATADVRYRDRYLLSLPLFHVGALTPLTGNVYRGTTTVVMRAFDPVRSWELIRDERITTALAVPAMLNFMLRAYEKLEGYQIPAQLRWIMSGAAPVPVSLIEAYARLGVEVHQVYGLTETCGPACLTSPDEALAKVGSTGKPFFHTEVRVVNERGEDALPGEPGEVLVRGPHVMKEYWNRPDATAETIRDGWLHTGDVATLDKDGCVFIHDRTKDMIISGGENVYPAEIENVILQHPKVAEVAVIGQPSAKWGESPLAVVVRGEPDLTAGDVLDYAGGRLARFKLPKAVEFVDEIPRNPSGKVLKRLLRERFPGPAPE
jgi:acyl-CoA synthetase (AMP-forming)/AMP-acid ligase II